MIELGKVQELEIIRKKDFGVYLAEKEGDEAAVLLPKRQVPEGAGIGDKVEVFIYKDSSDRLIATTGKPKLQVGETAKLEVKDVAKIGAFLDMGLEKDLLLPFKEQTHPVRKGEQCLVTLYVDKSRRLAATMRVYSHMSNQSPYKAEDWVTGTVYEINETIGAFVAVDHKYYGLIPKKELYGRFREGDTVQARVTRVREDGKLLMVRQYRYALGRETIELPAGGLNGREEPTKLAAIRELQEETGYLSEDMEFLTSIYTTVAFCNEKIDIYLARNLKTRGEQHLDEDEFINVEAYSVEELKQMIFESRIQDSKTICGILTYAAKYLSE